MTACGNDDPLPGITHVTDAERVCGREYNTSNHD